MPTFSVLLSRKSTGTDAVRLLGTVTDLDTDTFRYRILINNQAWIPWTEVGHASLAFSYAIPCANFIAGQANEIKIEGSDEASPSPVFLWSGSVYRYPVQPAVVTVDKPVGEVHKGEPYAFPFSITAPYVKDYVAEEKVQDEGELEDGNVYSVLLDTRKFIKLRKIEVE